MRMNNYATATEASRTFGVARTTLIYAAKRGDVASVQTYGGTVLLDVKSVRRWVKHRRLGRKK
jgi:hypothetical protein